MKKNQFKIFFLVTSTSQVEMFHTIYERMNTTSNFTNIAINIDTPYHNNNNVQDRLDELNFESIKINRVNRKNIHYLLKKYKPTIIILGNDRGIAETLFINISKLYKIPTLLIQDGVISGDKQVYSNNQSNFFLGIIKKFHTFIKKDVDIRKKFQILFFELKYRNIKRASLYGLGGCNKIAVFGENVRENLISKGVSSEKIIVTGNPKFDEIFFLNNNSSDIKDKIKDKLQIKENEIIILLLTQYFVEMGLWKPIQRELFVKSISNAVNQISNCRLVIKIHPVAEKLDDYNKIFELSKNVPLIVKDLPTLELLNLSSLVITVSSTTALEALILKKPVLIVNLFNDRDTIFKNSCCLYITKKEDLIPSIQEIIENPLYKNSIIKQCNEFIYKNAYLQDGEATNRIVNLIKEMIAEVDNFGY